MDIGKVSIIMPCYNSEEFISDSIESVINQEYKNWELIIVDDFSKDNSYEKIRPYLDDSRVRCIRNAKNFGGAVSRNIAIKQSEGRYIAFLDSDDLWHKNKLNAHIKFMIENEIGFT